MNTLEARRRLLGRNVYKRTTEGNPAIAQGSLARMYPGITMQGWTEQDQYDGKNLFDISKISTTWNGTYGITNNNDGTLSVAHKSGDSKILTNETLKEICPNMVAGNTYFLSFTTTGPANYIYINGSVWNDGRTRIITEDDLNSIVSFYTGLSEFELCSIKDVMINEGSIALPYEPYTGNQPSPNPDYPQEIVSAGKYNEETQKYEVEVKLTGKNFFDIKKASDTSNWIPSNKQKGYSDFIIKVNKGKKYTISYEGELSTGLGFFAGIVNTTSEISEVDMSSWLYHSTAQGLIINKLTFTAFNGYVSLRINYSGINTALEFFKNLQLEESEIKTDYQEYKEQTVTLTSDRPLTKWDKLEKRNGQWGWVYKSAEKVLDGTEGYTTGSGKYISDFSSNCYTVISDMVIDGRDNVFMNRLSNIDFSWVQVDAIGFSKNLNQLHVRISNADLGTTGESSISEVTAAMKSYMAQQYEEGNLFVFWYETAEETFVPLSESEQEQMNALHTFHPTTVLSNDAGCEMALTYKTKKSLEVTD